MLKLRNPQARRAQGTAVVRGAQEHTELVHIHVREQYPTRLADLFVGVRVVLRRKHEAR